jgi:hypothetical protein
MKREHLGWALTALVFTTLLLSGIIVFKNQKTVTYTYAGGRRAEQDIAKVINR